MTAARINVEFVYPPIPIRSMDWQATLEGYEGGDPIGRGATAEAARADLLEQLDDYCACAAALVSEQEQRNGVCDACL